MTLENEIRITSPGSHLVLPTGTASKFAVGDTVTVTAYEDADEATAHGQPNPVGQTGQVIAAYYLIESQRFAYHVELGIAWRKVDLMRLTVVESYDWPMLETELRAYDAIVDNDEVYYGLNAL
jgi:hypothetical protein